MCVYSLFIIPPTIFIIIIQLCSFCPSITPTIFIIITQLCSFCPSCFLNLFLDNIFAVIKQHGMQKPIEILRSHSLKNSLKSTQPCIELLTCLCIECPFIIWLPTFIIVQNYKIWCRTIRRIAIFLTYIICCSMHQEIGKTLGYPGRVDNWSADC